jgi:hypothetical protein
MRQAAACRRAVKQTADPVLTHQLREERQLWLTLARQSAAIENLMAQYGFDAAPKKEGDPLTGRA